MTLEWIDPEPDPTAIERNPAPCRHPKYRRVTFDGPGAPFCGSCGHVFDPAKQRMGRNARSRGKAVERREMRLAGIHTGNANKADDGLSVDGLFAFQSKVRPSAAFPGWQSLELDKLRVAHPGKVPVLLIVEAPGRGNRPRKLAVLEWADWLELHGPERSEP